MVVVADVWMMPGRISKNMAFPRFSGWRGWVFTVCDSGDGFFLCVFDWKIDGEKKHWTLEKMKCINDIICTTLVYDKIEILCITYNMITDNIL